MTTLKEALRKISSKPLSEDELEKYILEELKNE